jgi:hypothetical protein
VIVTRTELSRRKKMPRKHSTGLTRLLKPSLTLMQKMMMRKPQRKLLTRMKKTRQFLKRTLTKRKILRPIKTQTKLSNQMKLIKQIRLKN